MIPHAQPRWHYEIDGVGVRKGCAKADPSFKVEWYRETPQPHYGRTASPLEYAKVFRPDGGGQIVVLVEPLPWVLPDESGFL